MSDPVSFTSTSPRFGLPYLFAGQSQKEFFVNEAHALTDMLLHPSIAGEAATPPSSPQEGECWLVGSGATDGWSGHDGALACFQSGNWLFVSPRNGMLALDQQTSQLRRYDNGWKFASAVSQPDGGSVVDAEARQAISGLIQALVDGGILPGT